MRSAVLYGRRNRNEGYSSAMRVTWLLALAQSWNVDSAQSNRSPLLHEVPEEAPRKKPQNRVKYRVQAALWLVRTRSPDY